MNFPNILLKNWKNVECWLICSFLWYLITFFVRKSSISMFKNFRKNWNFYGLELLQRRWLKILVLLFINFIGIWKLGDALFTSSFKIFFNLFLINLRKIKTAIFTFISNCNNTWVVSIFQHQFYIPKVHLWNILRYLISVLNCKKVI